MTSPHSREAILARLGAAQRPVPAPVDPGLAWRSPDIPPGERVRLLAERMRAVGTRVIQAPLSGWRDALAQEIARLRPKTLAYGPGAWFAPELAAMLAGGDTRGLPLDGPAEQFRDALFAADASVTTARAAIAENGSLLLTPDGGEPRLLSLVPPVHMVLLKASDILATFAEALDLLASGPAMPANALLVSGPSKTADIELILAYGAHGPRDLTVIVLE